MIDQEKVTKVLDKLREKTADDASAILWMRTNLNVMKLVISWGKIQHTFTGEGKRVPKDEYDKWRWLWKNYSFSLREWLEVAGIVDQAYGAKLADRIIRMRLVFPDGTYPQIVREFLNIAALAKQTAE